MTSEAHAVVIGGGIAGLFAARILADFYATVTVVDRDKLPLNGDARGGAPQGRHVHYVQTGAALALRELFPGLIEKLVAAGAPEVDPLADGLWYIDGSRFISAPSGLQGIGVTRPVLEHEIRQRVRQLPNVRFDVPCHVVALTSSPDRSVVTGVRVRRGGDETDRSEEALAGDLVVDCSGRGSRTPRWLAELGYPRPGEDRIAVDVGYASCMFRLPADVLGRYLGAVVSATSTNPRAGVLVRIEDGRWQVSLAGFAGVYPPVTPDGFLEFAADLAVPDLYRALCAGTPVDRPVRFRIPAAVRRRYEQLSRFPDRLVVLGDAVSVFNPVYAQGMAVAAQEAMALRHHLRRRPDSFPLFRREVAAIGRVAWDLSVTGDLSIRAVPRPPSFRLTSAYTGRLYRAARRDAVVARAFLRVAHLVDPPTRILRPGIALRVLRATSSADHEPSPGRRGR